MILQKQWMLYFAYQLQYINNEQKSNLNTINLACETVLKKILSREKLQNIRNLCILQQLLLEAEKCSYLTKNQCNQIIQEQIHILRYKQKVPGISKEIQEHFPPKKQKEIINTLLENQILEHKDLSIVFKIFGNYETKTRENTQEAANTMKKNFPEDRVEHYNILGQIGAGGMGIVYKAFDTITKRVVAIKAIQSKSLENELSLKRFYREVEISSSLTHPNLLRIYHFGKIHDIPYLVMEYVEGEPLLYYIKKNDLSLSKQLILLKNVANALEYAHKKKVLHRDIKPSNILVRADGSAVLMDFGLAKNRDIKDKSLTQSGEVIGTPQYMSPEQAKGQRHQVGQGSDIYSLGAVLYHILTGAPPAMGDVLINILHQVAHKKVGFSKEEKKSIPLPVRCICKKALEKKISKRYLSSEAFEKDIDNYLNNRKVCAITYFRNKFLLFLLQVILVFLFFLGCAYFLYYQRNKEATPHQKIVQLYQEGKKEQNQELAYIKFSKALELFRKYPKLSQNKKEKYLILKALYKNYFTQGEEKQSLEEAKIYYERAKFFLQQFPLKYKKYKYYQKHILKTDIAILRCIFSQRAYFDAYSLGKNILAKHSVKEIHWMVLVSSYHCKQKDTMMLIKELQQKLQSNNLLDSKEYIGSLYYQGLLNFYKKDYPYAKKLFAQALKRMKKTYDFSDSLSLYFLAVELINFDKVLSTKEIKNIEEHFALIKTPEIKTRNLYKETLSRLYLQKLQKDPLQKSLANNIIAMMEQCIHSYPAYEEYYFIRAKGYEYLKEYKKAFNDYITATTIAPQKIRILTAKLNILAFIADTKTLKTHSQKVFSELITVLHVRNNIFQKRFQELREQYEHLRHDYSREVTFSQKQFEVFYKKLFQGSSDIRKLVKKMILSMRPYKMLEKELQKKRKGLKEEKKKIISQLLKKLQAKLKRKRFEKLLVMLTQRESFKNLYLQYFLENAKNLKSILFDQEAQYAIGNKSNWDFMRYNAAKIMVKSSALRMYLVNTFIISDKHHISTRILVAHALYKVGYTFYDKSFLRQFIKRSDNFFLKTLAIMCISPTDPDSFAILKKLLYHKDQRIQIMSATRFVNVYKKEVKYRVVNIFARGQKHKDAHFRALSTLIFWSDLLSDFYLIRRYNIYQKWYPTLLKAMNDPAEIVQIAAFFNLRQLCDYRVDEKKALSVIRKLYKNSKSPFIKYHAVTALARLIDLDLIEKIAMNTNSSLTERLAVISGLTNSKSTTSDDFQITDLLSKFNAMITRELVDSDKNIALKGFMLYSLTIAFKRLTLGRKGRMFSTLFFGVFKKNILALLQSKNHFVQFVTLLSFYNLTHTPPSLIESLKKIGESSGNYSIKAIIMGIVIAEAKKNSTLRKRIHEQIKARGDKNDKKTRTYRNFFIRGYFKDIAYGSLRFKTLRAFYPGPVMNIHPLQIKYQQRKIIQFKANHKKVKKHYIHNLEKILDIYFSITNITKEDKENLAYYTSILIYLYEMGEKYQQALFYLEKIFKKYGWYSADLIAKWAQIKNKLGERKKTIAKLEYLLSKPQWKFSAPILRVLASLYQKEHQNRKAIELIWQQYKIKPYDPKALSSLGHLYCDMKQYKMAEGAFTEYALHYPAINAHHKIGMARIYIAKNDQQHARYLLNSVCYNYFVTLQDLNYPEIKNLSPPLEGVAFLFLPYSQKKALRKKQKRAQKMRKLLEGGQK